MALNNCEQSTESKGYFGLHIPPDVILDEEDESCSQVYESTKDMRYLLKKYKTARFKYFDSWESAQNFSIKGCEGDSLWSSEALYSDVSILKSISKHELIEFRKLIEDNNVRLVQNLIDQNPRYLIGSSDFPAILKEGPRYNALHIAAKAKCAEIASHILKTVSDANTFVRLYGPDINNRSNVKRASLLLDLYLNTPDKTLQETPLHFAAKHAASKVVEVLVSYPECQKDRLNKYDQTPFDIIASREQNISHEEIEKIKVLLTNPFYVPVLRSEDNSCQPIIGDPFSPNSPLSPKAPSDIVSPKLEIKAIAGPMGYDQAYKFKRQWKTPPRIFQSPNAPSSTPLSNQHCSPRSPIFSPCSPIFSPARRLVLDDLDKGLEIVGRSLAKEKNVGWKEYWPFLNDFVDLQCEEGLRKLEAYLKERFNEAASNCFMKHMDENLYLNLSEISNSTNDSHGIIDHDNSAKITELCQKFQGLNVNSPKSSVSSNQVETQNLSIINGSTGSSTHMPYLCVEKACQVFAKRVAEVLLGNYSNNNLKKSQSGNTLQTYLNQEIKHINSLVGGYIDDSAFKNVKFSLLHHRLATWIVSHLLSSPNRLDSILLDLNNLVDKHKQSNNPETPPSRSSLAKFMQEETLKCVIQHCTFLLNSILRKDSGDGILAVNYPLASEKEVQGQWELSKCCDCKYIFESDSYLSPKRARNKIRSLNTTYSTHSTLAFSSNEDIKSKSNFNDFLEDSSESEEEWHDPLPLSTTSLTSVGVEENEEAMSLSVLGPELYIKRTGPCKIDLDVLEAINNIELDLAKYPMICYWKLNLENHPPDVREKWRQAR